jgi:hypothetical protein
MTRYAIGWMKFFWIIGTVLWAISIGVLIGHGVPDINQASPSAVFFLAGVFWGSLTLVAALLMFFYWLGARTPGIEPRK